MKVKNIGFALLLGGLTVTSQVNIARALSTTNLLTNPGAETGDLTGWTVGGTSNPTVDSGTFDPGINPHSGSYDFVGGTGAYGTLTQTIALVGNQGITTSQIDSSSLDANISFWEQGLNQGTPSDDAQVTLYFYDTSGNLISSVSTPVIDSHNGTWQNYTNSYSIPVNTRSLSYQMDSIRNVGIDLDAFIDDNSLTVSTQSVGVPWEFNSNEGLALGVVFLIGLRISKNSLTGKSTINR